MGNTLAISVGEYVLYGRTHGSVSTIWVNAVSAVMTTFTALTHRVAIVRLFGDFSRGAHHAPTVETTHSSSLGATPRQPAGRGGGPPVRGEPDDHAAPQPHSGAAGAARPAADQRHRLRPDGRDARPHRLSRFRSGWHDPSQLAPARASVDLGVMSRRFTLPTLIYVVMKCIDQGDALSI